VSQPHITVVAAIIERNDSFLLTQRSPGTHLAGLWEFPGGKCHPPETHVEALRRELHEELDIAASVGSCEFSVTHDYGDRVVTLHFYRCEFEGEPKPMLGQEMVWVARGALASLALPEADRDLIARLTTTKREHLP
jgi:8-oxo-dGTP diphosphatase